MNTKPAWEQQGYCWKHRFKVKLGLNSITCSCPKSGHCKDATHTITKNGSNTKSGWPKPPTWWGAPAVAFKNIEAQCSWANYVDLDTGCINPYNKDQTTLANPAANLTLLTKTAPVSANTHTNLGISGTQPAGARMQTTHAMDLLLSKLLLDACMITWLPSLVNNLLSVPTLVDTGCKVDFHKNGCEVIHSTEK